ncbi:MAG: protein kinase, partial [Polyangiaceae bacterium]
AANILFDADGEPKVCDFGLARPTDGTRTHIGGGTWGWMSPEQVRREALTTASDVFALGVLLHWLLERKLPFGNGADFEARVQQEDPKPPGPWRPEVEWSLHAVCQRALHRDPKARYGTALELVKDLERLRTHRPLQAGRTPLVGSLWYWAQRHAAVPYVIAGLLTVMTVVTLLTAQRQKAELRRVVLDMNAYAAGGQAARVLYRLRENATRIEQAARDPGIKAIAINSSRASGATPADDQSCAEESALASPEALRPYSEGFDTMFVMSRWGCARARLPVEPNNLEYVHRHFEWQHYFRGVEQAMLRGEVPSWVRSAYRSSITQHTKDAISAPIFQGDRWLGVVSGSMTSASAFNRPYAKLESDERMTVLLGALERAPSGSGPAVSNFAYLVHPRLRFGDKLTLDREHAARLERTFGSDSKRQFELANISPLSSADYVDPLLGGRWLAAFAPVGHTGDFVLVQTLDAAATRPANVIVRIGYGLGAASCAALVAVAIFATWTRRRKRSLAAAA